LQNIGFVLQLPQAKLMKKIAILGSTGSIGTSALGVARHLPSEVQVVALAARGNIALLEAQVREFHPRIVAVFEFDAARALQLKFPDLRVVAGMEGLQEVASHADVDFVLAAISGSLGILPTVAAIKSGKQIGLANKEVLVAAGAYIMQLAKECGSQILPVDSEHSAIFQCLEEGQEVRRLILTASGGPFWRKSQEELEGITVEQALNHPNWKMGPKITIDSSTLMNKGLEVIEAHFLFGMPVSKIEVVIHPQSVIHSMVEYVDGSMMAQMSEPNMCIPIQYAMTYPKRMPGLLPPFDFSRFSQLDFLPRRKGMFRCLELAYDALGMGGTAPCYLNAANEVLVQQFLERKIGWKQIGEKLDRLMQAYSPEKEVNLENILAVDALARAQATRLT
jgi:1-deoxy-D-xylulose-5-phosphate reductoisomerase